MISSQKVSRVPPEVFQQFEEQPEETGSVQAEQYRFVSTTEK